MQLFRNIRAPFAAVALIVACFVAGCGGGGGDSGECKASAETCAAAQKGGY
jgi:hypothetical protein